MSWFSFLGIVSSIFYKRFSLLSQINKGFVENFKIDSLYCWKIDKECHLIDGKPTINSYYQTSDDDNPRLIPYNFAQGEFLEGKYQGIWKYYDKKRQAY